MVTRLRSQLGRFLLVCLLLPVLTATTVAQSDDGEDDMVTPARLGDYAAYTYQHAQAVEGLEVRSVFGNDHDPSVIPDSMTVGQQRFNVEGARIVRALAELAATGTSSSDFVVHSTGVETFFSTSATTNLLAVFVPRAFLDCLAGTYAELAIFEIYEATFKVLANALAPNDPGVGTSSAYSLVCRDGELTLFFGIADESGFLVQYQMPIGVVEVRRADGVIYLFVTPRDVDLRVAMSGAGDMNVPEVAVATAPDGRYSDGSIVQPSDVPTDPADFNEMGRQLLASWGDGLAADDADEPADDPAPLEPEPSTEDGPVGDGIPEGAVVVDVDNPTGDADEGGGNGMVFVVLGFFFVLGTAILVVYGKWKKKPPAPEGPGTGKPLPPPTESDPEVPSEPESPPVPPGPGPQPTRCDWELHIRSGTGWKRLKKADPGHTACCVYKVAIETTVDEFEQDAKMADEDTPGRESVPVYASQASGMTLGSSATTRSMPDPAPPDAGQSRPDGWQRLGEPDVAASVDRSEATKVSVDLESKCTDASSEYTSSVESSVVLGTLLECENANPGDECEVDIAAVGSASVAASGELVTLVERAVGPEPDDPDDPAPPGDWDMHDHDPHRSPAAPISNVERDRDVVTKDSWKSVFTASTTVQARQVVPVSVWSTTDEVKAHIEQISGHVLDLRGLMSKGDCAPTGCCTGSPDHICNCNPDFTLHIDGANSTIVADGQTWSLTRPAGPANGAALPAYLEWTT